MQDDVTNFFNTLTNTKGTNAKMDFVRQKLSDKTITKLLEMTFNPYVSFNVVKVPKTKKLLQLKVDVGIDVRTIVSGIVESFSPEDIIGQQVTVLTNLAPRKIRGVESQGMILMTDMPDGKLAFVEPEQKVSNGQQIS